MNKVILIGRLTRDPEIRVSTTGNSVARYTLAVDRGGKDKGADFIPCVVFGDGVSFVEKYLGKGKPIAIEGRIQTGSYNKDNGEKAYSTDIVVSRHEFVPRDSQQEGPVQANTDSFMAIPDGIDEELPFN